MRRLLAALRAETGHNVIGLGAHRINVRSRHCSVGEVRGPSSNAPGELATLFSTPGLAIASQYTREQVRTLVAQSRRRRIALGRRFSGIADIEKALRDVRARGLAVGYNMRADGWGMLAWPIAVTTSPLRIGALALGAPVAVLRRDETRLVQLTQKFVANYLREQNAAAAKAVG